MTIFQTVSISIRTSPFAFLSMLVGCLCFLLSFVYAWEVPSSGAVMICSVVVAELAHRRSWLSRAAPLYSGKWFQAVKGNGSFIVYDQMPVQGAITPNTTSSLMSLERNGKLFVAVALLDRALTRTGNDQFKTKSPAWEFSANFRRVESVFVVSAGCVAVLGSLIWAYGHLIW